MNLTRESWKPVVGHEGAYEVSDLGRVRSLARFVRTKGGGWKPIPSRILIVSNACGQKRGRVSLSHGDSSKVHRLVLEAFVGPAPAGMVACHNDGDPSNNALTNLRWDTPKNNCADTRRHGRQVEGERCHSAKLTAEQVCEIRRGGFDGAHSYTATARRYGVHRCTITRVITGKTWRGIKRDNIEGGK